ncbi:hypothetical protein [Acaryochloris thomasi]|nr:hypothetical protein [Acaryochloris thomasi]
MIKRMDAIDIPEQLPFLEAISWQADKEKLKSLEPFDMLRCYERGWQNLGVLSDPSDEEWAFIRALVERYKSWLISEFQ